MPRGGDCWRQLRPVLSLGVYYENVCHGPFHRRCRPCPVIRPGAARPVRRPRATRMLPFWFRKIRKCHIGHPPIRQPPSADADTPARSCPYGMPQHYFFGKGSRFTPDNIARPLPT
nr:hypothetical protein RVX_1549 [Nitratidesulfovibrio sp. HK-II]